MIKVVAESLIREDCLEQFLEASKTLVEKTVALDEGCISYALYQDAANPLHTAMIEEWESQEALDKHMKSAHLLGFIPKMGECREGPPVMALYNKLF